MDIWSLFWWKEGSGKTILLSAWQEGAARQESGSSPRERQDKGKWPQIRENSSLKEWLSIVTGSPGKCWSHHPWRCLRTDCMWQCYDLVDMLVFGGTLDSMIMEVFSNLNASTILLESPILSVLQTIPIWYILIYGGTGTFTLVHKPALQ